jgi:hypothetical protein
LQYGILLKNSFFLIVFSIGVLCTSNLSGQDTLKSLAFKNNRPTRNTVSFYQPDLSYKLWEQFALIQEANSGNVEAQHELGLRYLTGHDVPADTLKGAYWIKKAAEQKFPPAEFNYGILLINGWGVEWDPYKAFQYFYLAASQDMAAAEYVIGLIYTDDLIIKRNMAEAYKWVKKAANDNLPQAKESLAKLMRFAPAVNDSIPKLTEKSDKKNSKEDNDQSSLKSSSGLVFIDFDMISDSIPKITYTDLLEDLKNTSNKSLENCLKYTKDSTLYVDSTSISTFSDASDYGSPEALNILGDYLQNGIWLKKDLVAAAEFYIRSSKVDSRKGSILLYNLIKEKDFYLNLKKEVDRNNSDALYVWYGLYSLGLDHQITEGDAINFLRKSAASNNMNAIVEMGLNYFKGQYVKQDKQKAVEIWNVAMKSGNKEAKIRFEIANLFNEIDLKDKNDSFNYLNDVEGKGSILAQLSLADCYFQGITVPRNQAKAVYYFRLAAVRGSLYAYNQLKKIYEDIKPVGFETTLNKQ